MVMICGVKPIPAEPDSHSPSKTIEFCIINTNKIDLPANSHFLGRVKLAND